MNLASIRENRKIEKRIAVTPEIVKKYINLGFKVNLQKNYLGRATFVYKNHDENEGSVVICKNQTCSEKLKDLSEVKNYLENRI